MLQPRMAILFLFAFFSLASDAQLNYSNFVQQTARIKALGNAYPAFAKVKSITKTAGGKDLWQITIGSGNTEKKPAIVVVGGAEGSHLFGMELALGFAENLLQGTASDSIKALLNKTTFYVYPNVSPDGMEQYFAAIKYERQGNTTPTDDDRDGKVDEDGFDDLDGNGKITLMRVESPIGNYRINPEEPRSLIKADPVKGEKGKYLLLTEGTDNDGDRIFNEDGEGGIWFNKSLSYKWPAFTQGAGEFPVSSQESRVLLDTLFERFNVHSVVSFGSNNNLSTPYAFNPQTSAQTLIGSWLQPDVRADSMISEVYNKTVNLKNAPKASPVGGDLLSWAYYHYGRYSFSTPGWWIPKSKPDTTKGEKAFTIDDPISNYLRWSSQQGISNSFTDWKEVQHPDFPGQKVEVGGIDPFVLINPPYKLVPDLVKTHTQFITKLASLQPEIDIINVRTEKMGGGVTRVTADVVNRGALAAPSKLGERSYWVKRIVVQVATTGNQSVISGRKFQTLNSLEGFGTQQLSWLLKGTGKVTIEAGSPSAGSKSIDINL